MKTNDRCFFAAVLSLLTGLVFVSMPARAEQSVLTNLQNKAAEAWEKLTPDVEVNRDAYVRVTGDRLNALKQGIQELKSSPRNDFEGESWEEISTGLDRMETEAESQYNRLQTAVGDSWRDKRSDVDKALKAARSDLDKAADKVLPERDAYAVKTGQRLAEMNARLQKLEAKRAETTDQAEQAKLDGQIKELKDRHDGAQQHLDQLKTDKTETWKTHRDAIEALLK
ncbi:MAG TPA: hypothetical protein VL688_10140 [Verrucomicrobiae bacterium]|jgi:hypothetical protein|nr:hypothetical protein [Verrucomicrobiae bacterium]